MCTWSAIAISLFVRAIGGIIKLEQFDEVTVR